MGHQSGRWALSRMEGGRSTLSINEWHIIPILHRTPTPHLSGDTAPHLHYQVLCLPPNRSSQFSLKGIRGGGGHSAFHLPAPVPFHHEFLQIRQPISELCMIVPSVQASHSLFCVPSLLAARPVASRLSKRHTRATLFLA